MINVEDHGNNVDIRLGESGLSLKFNDTIALVGGGLVEDSAFELAKSRAKSFLAADSGGDEILRRGAPLEAVIGDLDSLSAAAREAIPPQRLIHVAEQDSTDFEKALARIDAPLILAVGFTGVRLDHELAALHGVVRFPGKRVVLIGGEDIIVHLPARLRLSLPAQTRVSLFPLDSVTLGLDGLEWSFDAIELHPARRIGTSNRAIGGRIDLRSDQPGCLLILPVSALDALTEGLASADFHSHRG